MNISKRAGLIVGLLALIGVAAPVAAFNWSSLLTGSKADPDYAPF